MLMYQTIGYVNYLIGGYTGTRHRFAASGRRCAQAIEEVMQIRKGILV